MFHRVWRMEGPHDLRQQTVLQNAKLGTLVDQVGTIEVLPCQPLLLLPHSLRSALTENIPLEWRSCSSGSMMPRASHPRSAVHDSANLA